MGFFEKLGRRIDKAFEVLGNLVRKIGNLIKTAIRKVAMCIGKFFTLLTQWLETALRYVEATFNVIVNGVQSFLKKVGDEYQEISYNYTKQNNGSFIKNTVVKQTYVSEEEIPEDIRALAVQMENGNMIDISRQSVEKLEYAEMQLC